MHTEKKLVTKLVTKYIYLYHNNEIIYRNDNNTNEREKKMVRNSFSLKQLKSRNEKWKFS